ncbi:MAG TPA: glycoside hydrolase family 1 protein [Candidatus Paceibacterota bacterium]|nr:glycoside hydrolase family 1 protein [Candidatus Paceibacterota bacterium]
MDYPFFWGAATSAWQVEGGIHNDWTEWELATAKRRALAAKDESLPDFILKGDPDPLREETYISGRAADHYNRFEKDFDIAKSLGHNAHRFSIEWSRIEPEEGKWNDAEIEHYRKVIDALRDRGMEPFVTLWHFTLPLWLEKKGGVRAKKFPEYFARYAAFTGERLKHDVKFWATLNEPEVYAAAAYFRGIWPPEKRGPYAFFAALRNLARAHEAGYHALKLVDSTFNVGAVVDRVFFESAGGFVNDTLTRIAAAFWNGYFLNRTRRDIDFIGLNYYFRNRIDYGFNKNENREVSDVGWELYPEGIYRMLTDLAKYGKPIYVTENGVADARDAYRAKFVADHIDWMKKAMAEGVDVRGYFHWSLLDNVELAKGKWPRFGLVEVNYKTMERKIRPSAWEYKKIISS